MWAKHDLAYTAMIDLLILVLYIRNNYLLSASALGNEDPRTVNVRPWSATPSHRDPRTHLSPCMGCAPDSEPTSHAIVHRGPRTCDGDPPPRRTLSSENSREVGDSR